MHGACFKKAHGMKMMCGVPAGGNLRREPISTVSTGELHHSHMLPAIGEASHIDNDIRAPCLRYMLERHQAGVHHDLLITTRAHGLTAGVDFAHGADGGHVGVYYGGGGGAGVQQPPLQRCPEGRHEEGLWEPRARGGLGRARQLTRQRGKGTRKSEASMIDMRRRATGGYPAIANGCRVEVMR